LSARSSPIRGVCAALTVVLMVFGCLLVATHFAAKADSPGAYASPAAASQLNSNSSSTPVGTRDEIGRMTSALTATGQPSDGSALAVANTATAIGGAMRTALQAVRDAGTVLTQTSRSVQREATGVGLTLALLVVCAAYLRADTRRPATTGRTRSSGAAIPANLGARRQPCRAASVHRRSLGALVPTKH